MLFQPTNITPDEKSGIGLGTIDAANGMTVKWQVNGDYPVMTAFQLKIYQRNTASTLLYDTGRLTANCPFYGTDQFGNPQFFEYDIPQATLSSHGISNGGKYKYTITQYYMDGSTERSVTQSSASTFITRATPVFEISNLPATVTSSKFTFTVSFSQAQGDTLNWIRYQIGVLGAGETDIIYDSGNLYGVSVYEVTYDGFQNGITYAIRVLGQTSSGVGITASIPDDTREGGWYSFDVSYSVEEPTGAVSARVWRGHTAVILDWSAAQTVSGQTRWTVYRKKGNSEVLTKIAEIPVSRHEIYDFGAASGQEYQYLLFPTDDTEFIGSPLTSSTVNPCFFQWTILQCTKRTVDDTVEDYPIYGYRVDKEFHFRYNLDSGIVSNNNAPNVLANFTSKPTIQQNPQNYLSGTLSSLIGTVSGTGEYRDSIELRNAIMELSVTRDPLILKSSKGDVKFIKINGNVTASTAEGTMSLAQSVSVPWIESDDAGDSSVFDLNTDIIT